MENKYVYQIYYFKENEELWGLKRRTFDSLEGALQEINNSIRGVEVKYIFNREYDDNYYTTEVCRFNIVGELDNMRPISNEVKTITIEKCRIDSVETLSDRQLRWED